MRTRSILAIIFLLLLALLLAACAAPAAPAPAPAAPAEEAAATEEAPAEEAAAAEYKLAAIFPGVITDADYNTLGYLGTTAVEEDLGIDTAYSESVAVPDIEGVMREYIDGGYNIIFTHGGQFMSQTAELARQFPDIYFIGEGDAPLEDPPPNLWIIDRNFQVGFYGVGALAAMQSQTGKIGYLGGLTLPFSYAEVHAIEQAIADQGLDVELKAVWAGNFNDPAKARELADAMIAEDVDVIMGSLNLGMLGVFEAAKTASGDVWVTAKYTDKSSFAPDNYLTSLLYDFAGPLKEITTNIMNGETGGYYPLGFDTGVSLQEPQHVTDEVAEKIKQIQQDVIDGTIVVEKNIEPIE